MKILVTVAAIGLGVILLWYYVLDDAGIRRRLCSQESLELAGVPLGQTGAIHGKVKSGLGSEDQRIERMVVEYTRQARVGDRPVIVLIDVIVPQGAQLPPDSIDLSDKLIEVTGRFQFQNKPWQCTFEADSVKLLEGAGTL